jgi:hypothetical protein
MTRGRAITGTTGTGLSIPLGPTPDNVAALALAVYGSSWSMGFDDQPVEWAQSTFVIPDNALLSMGTLAGCSISQVGMTDPGDANSLNISYRMNANDEFYSALNDALATQEIGVAAVVYACSLDGANIFRMTCSNPFPEADLNGADLTGWEDYVAGDVGDLFSTDGTGLQIASGSNMIAVNFNLTMFIDRD